MRIVVITLVCLLIGLIVGYVLFGKIMGEYVSVKRLLDFNSQGLFGKINKAVNKIAGINEMRRNILLCGLAGAVVGAVAGTVMKKR